MFFNYNASICLSILLYYCDSLLIFVVDPFLSLNSSANYSIYDDLSLVFVLYFRARVKPSEDVYDFNCTLPIMFYDVDENTTVALGRSFYLLQNPMNNRGPIKF